MTPERWRRIEALFEQALELPLAARGPWLARQCQDDADLRSQVDILLAEDSTSDTRIRQPIADMAGAVSPDPDLALQPGALIGPYRLERLLGRGGMGAVFLATRADQQYHKQVAIKFLRAGLTSRGARELFLRERQILAQLEHPSVARLLDGGTLPNGQPYLVLDYVEGEPLLDFCQSHHTPLRQRLALFVKVCQAVAYAHQNLIVHRDLKPQNILVNAAAEPKLLDFGIAKLLASDWDAPPGATQVPTGLMTPQYASPEQIRGSAITTATDVYSLGAVLYELTSGARPYEVTGLPITELVHQIVERPVDPPNKRRAPQFDPIPADLGNIVLKSLEKDPARRYGSAEQLAADLERFLDGRAVLARGDSLWYRSRKFIRRHWIGVAAAAAIVGSLSAVAVQTQLNAREEARLRARADLRFQQVRHLANRFLFDFHDAIQTLPGSTPARRLVVSTALEYLDGLSRDNPSDPQLLHELASAYDRVGDAQGNPYFPNIGDVEGARLSYERAMALRRRIPATTPELQRDLVLSHLKLGDILDARGKTNYAQQEFEAALKLLPSPVPEQLPLLDAEVKVHMRLGDLHDKLNHAAQGLHHFRAARQALLRVNRLRPAPKSQSELSLASYKIGRMLFETGDMAASIAARREGVALAAQALQADPTNESFRRNLFINHLALGENLNNPLSGKLRNMDESLIHLKEARRLVAAISSADPANTQAKLDHALAWTYIGGWHEDKEQWPQAVEAFRQAAALSDALLRQNPTNRVYRLHAARNRKRMGAALAEIPDLANSLREIRASLAEYEALSDDATDAEIKNARVEALRDIGEVLRLMGRPLEGITPNQQAARLLETMVAGDPSNRNLPNHLSPIYQQLAKCHRDAAKANTSRPHWQSALDFWRKAQAAGGPAAARPAVAQGISEAETALASLR